jgi:hypothetical protein
LALRGSSWCRIDGGRALRRAAALIDGYGQAQPARELQIRRMLGAQYAVDALGLQDKFDERCDGFGW